jgi:hypothetical protein
VSGAGPHAYEVRSVTGDSRSSSAVACLNTRSIGRDTCAVLTRDQYCFPLVKRPTLCYTGAVLGNNG